MIPPSDAAGAGRQGSAELEAALARTRECLYDAAHARNERERQALETQAELLLKIVMELQERVQALPSDRH